MGVVLLSLALVLGISGSQPAIGKTRHTQRFTYVALGDSFTAGSGIPPATALACLRSGRDYPHDLASRLRVRAVSDVSCGGAQTANADTSQAAFGGVPVPPQMTAVNAGADLVTVSLGLNDADVFATIINTCVQLAPDDPRGAPCLTHFQTPGGDSILALMPVISQHVIQVLDEVHARAPHARVILVGYPQLVPDSGTCAYLPFAAGDYPYVHQFFVSLGAAMRNAAKAAGVDYLDTLALSQRHDACAGPEAWINGVQQSSRGMPWHPLAPEQRAIAAQLADLLQS
jgi:lysophospholipase L1-like esterase